MQNSGCGSMTLATAMVVIIVACGISEVGSPDQPAEKEQEGIGSAFRSVCCVSGFEYPSGYDWNKGVPEEDEVRCSLVVFADGVPGMSVPVGDGYEVSADPDMHRVIGGNLYTFHSKEGKTVMRRNGAPLFRYDGDEALVDMAVRDDGVYVLAHKRSGKGFTFRKDGKILLERFAGETFGRLWEDGDSLCFAFMQPVAMADGMDSRYYVAFDSSVVPVRIHDETVRVWDIMSEGGVPCVLASIGGLYRTVMDRGGEVKVMELPDLITMLSCSLFYADGGLGVECVYTYPDGLCESGILVEGSEYMRFETGCSIQALRYEGGRAHCILNPDDGEGMIFSAGELFRMPEGYYCEGDCALAVHEGELYVALSSKKGEPPLVWHGGQTDTLRLNGCVSSISFTEMNGDYSSQVRVRD